MKDSLRATAALLTELLPYAALTIAAAVVTAPFMIGLIIVSGSFSPIPLCLGLWVAITLFLFKWAFEESNGGGSLWSRIQDEISGDG